MTQSSNTYATVKGAIESNDAPFASRSFASFLQGSYGNNTNIFADSDVDVVVRLDSIYYHDISNMTAPDQAAFKTAASSASYSMNDFKREVVVQLMKKFGSVVMPSKKAIFVKGNGSRRDADVLACAQFRKYTSYRGPNEQNYVEGVTFWSDNGTQIINYPKQHSDNCTTKHQASNQRFKPMVRVMKNMRNKMIDKGYIKEGLAPSYFIEGLLYNAPDQCFGKSYADTFVSCINWLSTADRAKLVCANEQYYLQHPTSPVTWRAESCTTFLNSIVRFWNDS